MWHTLKVCAGLVVVLGFFAVLLMDRSAILTGTTNPLGWG